MKKYFIVYQTVWNGEKTTFNGIFEFNFNIIKNSENLNQAESDIAKNVFGDKRIITILNIIKA